MSNSQSGRESDVESDVVIDRISDADVPRVAELLTQMGYPQSAEQTRRTLDLLDEHDVVLVARWRRTLAGVASIHVQPLLAEGGQLCRLTSLVVDETVRGRGVGRALVLAVEAEAEAKGCRWVEVTTGVGRTAAAALYRSLGWDERPLRFLKVIRADEEQ